MTTALEGGEGSASRLGRSLPREGQVPFVQEAGWAPGPVWTSAKNLAPTGIRSADRPARSQSLYRLATRPTKGIRDEVLITNSKFNGTFIVVEKKINTFHVVKVFVFIPRDRNVSLQSREQLECAALRSSSFF